jgi:hypothetical protein
LKKTDVKETGTDGGTYMQLAYDPTPWRTLVFALFNLVLLLLQEAIRQIKIIGENLT